MRGAERRQAKSSFELALGFHDHHSYGSTWNCQKVRGVTCTKKIFVKIPPRARYMVFWRPPRPTHE